MTSASDCVPLMVTIKEASQRTGLSYDSLRKLCLSGRIVHLRAGSKFYVNFPKLIDFLDTSGTADQGSEGK